MSLIPEFDEALREYQHLTDRIISARAAYKDRDESVISDADYDALIHRLEFLESCYPQLQGQDSPTLSVGGAATSTFAPVTHLERMMSLDNVFSAEEFEVWAARVERDAGGVNAWLCELKIDGLAVDLVYVNGSLITMATRGDGKTGEDVTYNVQFIPGIPATLTPQRGVSVPALVEVRGEIFFPVEAFTRINDEQYDAGLPAFSNPRNAAAGTLRQRIDKREEELAEVRTQKIEIPHNKIGRH